MNRMLLRINGQKDNELTACVIVLHEHQDPHFDKKKTAHFRTGPSNFLRLLPALDGSGHRQNSSDILTSSRLLSKSQKHTTAGIC